MKPLHCIESISATQAALLEKFFSYLRDHVADNGAEDCGYFLPMPRSESRFSPEREQCFRAAMARPLHESGWRRLWLALSQAGEVLGHIDLRGHSEEHATHRCLLGLGVRRDCRRAGVASALIEHAQLWACTQGFRWIDLQVLSVNQRAQRLYGRAGFLNVGEIPEMFELDGQTFGYTSMCLRLSPRLDDPPSSSTRA